MSKLIIAEHDSLKIVKSENYNYIFNKVTGYFARWGKTKEDDPIMAPAPEIADIEISTICNLKCKACSPAGTKINTVDGEKNVEEVAVGDMVLSFDLNNNQRKINKVEEIYEKEYDGELIDIELEDGTIISFTPDHEIFTNSGWKDAGDLTEDDVLLSF